MISDTIKAHESILSENLSGVKDRAFYHTHWQIRKFANDNDFKDDQPFEVSDFDGNLLLNVGINSLLTNLLAAGGATAPSNANANVGVGDSSTAEAASQTGLQAATNKTYAAMDSSYPTYGTSQQIVFRGTFGSSSANYHWQEFTIDNGTHTVSLNRKVSDQGTKTSGQTWQVTVTITFS